MFGDCRDDIELVNVGLCGVEGLVLMRYTNTTVLEEINAFSLVLGSQDEVKQSIRYVYVIYLVCIGEENFAKMSIIFNKLLDTL